jgi:glutathione S-transferase
VRLYDYAPSANCYKVRLLLAQVGIEYERVPVDIFAGGTLSPEYAAKNPGLTTPVLELDSGQYLPESNAILLHLAEGTDLMPEDSEERAQVYRWLFFEQARVVAYVGQLRFRLVREGLDPGSDRFEGMRKMAAGIVAMVNGHLEGREFFVGDDYSVADIGMYGYLHVAHEGGIDMEPNAALRAWIDRVRDRPGHVADLLPYPENVRRGQSQSIYDLFGM